MLKHQFHSTLVIKIVLYLILSYTTCITNLSIYTVCWIQIPLGRVILYIVQNEQNEIILITLINSCSL